MSQQHSQPAILLSALISGLLFTPIAYIAIGALGAFSEKFSYFILPIFLLSAGYLIWRLFFGAGRESPGRWHVGLEVVCWVLVILFLVVVSGFRLFTLSERIGFASTLFLCASLISYPIVFFRGSSLLLRVTRLPKNGSLALALIILLVALASCGYYLLQPAKFI